MGTFTDAEVGYLNSQPLGRLATIGPDGRPHITPVGVFYDPETQTIVIGGHAGSNMVARRSSATPGAAPTWRSSSTISPPSTHGRLAS